MINLIFIFGTRPEVIKLAPLILKLKENKKIKITLCNTEQQKELSHQALDFFNLKSDINLDVMEPNQKLSNVQAKILNKLELEFQKNKYDGVIVQGDTMTVLCGATVAFYNNVPVFYLEAGLRSYDLYEPFPEEAIRQMVSRISTINFVPTQKSYDNLIKENIDKDNIFITGNTVVDALFCLSKETQEKAKLFLLNKKININKDFVLITCHRRENHQERLNNIICSIKKLSSEFKNMDFIIPVHPNPNVKTKIYENLNNIDNIRLLDPLDYPVLVELQKKAKLILTDSGGVQEEGPTFGCPILVLRYETERPEGIDAGFTKLVGANSDLIINESKKILSKTTKETRILDKKNPYGDGKASEKIAEIINKYFIKNA